MPRLRLEPAFAVILQCCWKGQSHSLCLSPLATCSVPPVCYFCFHLVNVCLIKLTMMQMIAVKIPNETGYMICFTGVICLPIFFSCTDEINCFCCLNTQTQKGLLLCFIPLKLFIHLFRSYSWNYWIFPLGVPVLCCESLKESRDGLSLLEHIAWFLIHFFLSVFPVIPHGNAPALGWKAISYFLLFLFQHYLWLWLMLTSVMIGDIPPMLSISTKSTELYSSIHSNYEHSIWENWERLSRIKKKKKDMINQISTVKSNS